jgi:mono/diheme cytochrome c family protein
MPGHKLASRRRIATHAVSATAIIFLFAWNGTLHSAARSQGDARDAAAARGQRQFQQSCGFCHGADATGARGPDLVRSALVAHDVMGNLLGEVIRQGRPDKGMPAMPLTDDQVSDIAAFLHARAAEGIKSASVPKAYPVEKPHRQRRSREEYFDGPVGAKIVTLPPAISRESPPSTLPSSCRRGCFIREANTPQRW